eukprot:Skav205035  [mRNA]  locus=scaffold2669:115951:116331:- [translate_table: standard]
MALPSLGLLSILAASAYSAAGLDTGNLSCSVKPCRRMPVIVDTDMDTDDQMALIFLLGEPSIEVKAITVSADGWSNQWSGVQNAMRLTQLYGQPDIPVAYSPKYNPDTQLNWISPTVYQNLLFFLA